MIIRFPVKSEELDEIISAMEHHGMNPDTFCRHHFRVWTEDNQEWLELEVQDDGYEYLQRTGFFAKE